MWHDRSWIALVPLFLFLANLGVSIPSFTLSETEPTRVFHRLGVADVLLSVALNLLVTGLISVRLIHAHRRLSRAIPLAKHRWHLNTIAILLESAAPLAICGLGLAIVGLLEDSVSVLKVDTMFFIGYRIAAVGSTSLYYGMRYITNAKILQLDTFAPAHYLPGSVRSLVGGQGGKSSNPISYTVRDGDWELI